MSDSDYNVIHNPNGWRTTTITCSLNADQVETVKHLHCIRSREETFIKMISLNGITQSCVEIPAQEIFAPFFIIQHSVFPALMHH